MLKRQGMEKVVLNKAMDLFEEALTNIVTYLDDGAVLEDICSHAEFVLSYIEYQELYKKCEKIQLLMKTRMEQLKSYENDFILSDAKRRVQQSYALERLRTKEKSL